MSLYLERSRFNFIGQAAWKRDSLKGESLEHLYSILALVHELTFDFICLRAATERSPHPLSGLFYLTAARPSRHLSRAHITVYSERISVRFEITNGVDEIDVTEISTDSGPSGGGGQFGTTPTISPSKLSLYQSRLGKEDVGDELDERVAARDRALRELRRELQLLNASYNAAFAALRLLADAKLMSAARSMGRSWFFASFSGKGKVKSSIPDTLNMHSISRNRKDQDYRGGKDLDPFVRVSEALVQTSPFYECMSLETAMEQNSCNESWSDRSNLVRALKRVCSLTSAQSNDRRHVGVKIFYFGSECLSAKDKDAFAIATIEKIGRAKIYIHSHGRNLRQKNSVDLILAAAVSNLRKQDVASISVECDGHVPFSERNDIAARDVLSVWRRVFKTRHVLETESNSSGASNAHCQFLLNYGAQKAITDYYEVACERFASGMSRDDVYVWRELAYWIGRDRNWSEMSIVLRNLGKSDFDE